MFCYTTFPLFCQHNYIAFVARKQWLKHTATLFALSDHYILSREWRVIVDQVQTNYQCRPNGTIISQVWPSCWLWGILIMVGCRSSTFLAVEKVEAFSTAKNVELLGLHPILKTHVSIVICSYLLKSIPTQNVCLTPVPFARTYMFFL